MLVNTKITIFNKVKANREVKYQRSVIEYAFWEDRKGVNSLTLGVDKADASNVFIPLKSVKNYLPPKEFAKDPGGHLTLQAEDYIVKGVVEDMSISELLNKYDDVRVITTVDKNDFGSERMRHFRVGAK